MRACVCGCKCCDGQQVTVCAFKHAGCSVHVTLTWSTWCACYCWEGTRTKRKGRDCVYANAPASSGQHGACVRMRVKDRDWVYAEKRLRVVGARGSTGRGGSSGIYAAGRKRQQAGLPPCLECGPALVLPCSHQQPQSLIIPTTTLPLSLVLTLLSPSAPPRHLHLSHCLPLSHHTSAPASPPPSLVTRPPRRACT